MDRAARAHLTHALGPVLGLLEEPGVTDVYKNEDGTLWVERLGGAPEAVGTMSAADAERIVAAVAGTLGAFASPDHPWVEGELFGDGPRFDGVLPPVTLSPVFSIRVPASRVYALDEYVAAGAMTEAQAAAVRAGIGSRRRVVVAGAPGTGKTTLLNAIGHLRGLHADKGRVLVVQDTRELRLDTVANKTCFRTFGAFDEQMALRRVLRANAVDVWVGEVRGPEALGMLMAWNTGLSGCCSIHSDTGSADDALDRLDQMARLAAQADHRPMVAKAVDLVVGMVREQDGRRRVSGVWRVDGWDADARRWVVGMEA